MAQVPRRWTELPHPNTLGVARPVDGAGVCPTLAMDAAHLLGWRMRPACGGVFEQQWRESDGRRGFPGNVEDGAGNKVEVSRLGFRLTPAAVAVWFAIDYSCSDIIEATGATTRPGSQSIESEAILRTRVAAGSASTVIDRVVFGGSLVPSVSTWVPYEGQRTLAMPVVTRAQAGPGDGPRLLNCEGYGGQDVELVFDVAHVQVLNVSAWELWTPEV